MACGRGKVGAVEFGFMRRHHDGAVRDANGDGVGGGTWVGNGGINGKEMGSASGISDGERRSRCENGGT